MAKLIKATDKTTSKNAREVLQEAIGTFLANREGGEVDRLREGILISTDDGDVVVKVILKKEEIEYTEEDILDTYLPDEIED